MAGYTTIEPRLIALLNDSSEPFVSHPRLDLPPLLDHSIPKISGRPSPLEPSASIHNEKRSLLGSQQNESLDRDTTDLATLVTQNSSGKDRTLGCTSPQSLQKILDDVPAASHPPTSKRRQRTDINNDDFVQLPQPPKKQKAAKQVVPPIIIGLFEPPPNAALFPPIASSSFHDSHGRNSLNTGPLNEAQVHPSHDVQPKSSKKPETDKRGARDCAIRTRRKWTEDETTQLLLGVQAHGVGNWTKILQDPQFKFDGRKAVDLKDRFRTCCPAELCSKPGQNSPLHIKDTDAGGARTSRTKSSLNLDNILAESDSSDTDEKAYSSTSRGLQKSRTHRKKLEDLAQLGIREPFKRSQRRERRPFSKEEDRDILQGFEEFGPAWTRILADSRFNLKSRRPTDLRDRLRNRYPEKFLEEHRRGAMKETPAPVNESILETFSSQISGSQESLLAQREPAQALTSGMLFKDTFLDLIERPSVPESTDPLSFDWNDNLGSFQGTMGEMDISRILLDESWNPRKSG